MLSSIHCDDRVIVGVFWQLHWYRDDIFPTTIGKLLFSNAIVAGRP